MGMLFLLIQHFNFTEFMLFVTRQAKKLFYKPREKGSREMQ